MKGLLLLTVIVAATSQPKSVLLRTALHVHTTFSDGRHTIEEIARRAREEGIDAVVLGDHFLTRFEYGPPLLRSALAVSVNFPSLRADDLERYLQVARQAERATGVLVLPGVEITPFYYWKGSPFTRDLTINSAHRHLLVVFPDTPSLAGLSYALGEMSAPGVLEFRAGSLLMLWPLLPALWAVHRLRRQGRRSFAATLLAWMIAAGSVAALVRSWPYSVPRYSPYVGDAGAAPYQDALDASHSSSALTFWAHPETSAEFQHSRYPVGYRSEEYPQLIAATRGATGFASLYEGDRRAAAPAGPWDQALIEFVSGQRSSPVWTVGELDLHREGEAGGKFLGEVETVAFATEASRRSLLEALARGSMYAVRQPEDTHLRLESFRANCNGHEIPMGEQTRQAGPCRIDAKLRAHGEALDGVTVSLIRNGEVLARQDVDIDENGIELEWGDDDASTPAFYRLVARRGNRVALYGNPIFVRVEEALP